MTIGALLRTWSFKPLRHCPGRYVLTSAEGDVTLRDLLGGDFQSREFQAKAARDTVIVVPLEDAAGLISYRRADGTFVHTLNTPEGFQRKLEQLGIRWDDKPP